MFLGLTLALVLIGCGDEGSGQPCVTAEPVAVGFEDVSHADGRPGPRQEDYRHALVVEPEPEAGFGTLDPAFVVTGAELLERFGAIEMGELENTVVYAFNTEDNRSRASCYLADHARTGWPLRSIRVADWTD